MRAIDFNLYNKYLKFCKNIFKNQRFIGETALNMLIKESFTDGSPTRCRRYMVHIKLLQEKNKLFFPGEMLYHFSHEDLKTISKLQCIGKVKIKDNEIHLSSQKEDFSRYIQISWKCLKKTKIKLILKTDKCIVGPI